MALTFGDHTTGIKFTIFGSLLSYLNKYWLNYLVIPKHTVELLLLLFDK